MKVKDHPARVGLLIVFCIMVIISFILFIFSLFDSYYQVKIDNNFIGYYKTIDDFNNLYNKVIAEKDSEYKTDFYFNKEPVFTKVLVKKSFLKEYNNEQLINNNLQQKITIYIIYVDDNAKTYCKTMEEAEKLTKELKQDVKEDVKIEIKEECFSNIEQVDLKENNKNIINEKQKKVTSRGNIDRTVTASANVYNTSQFIWPTSIKTITSYYGERWGRLHTGIDIGVSTNSKIYAAADGIVEFSGWSGGYGYVVKIKHSNSYLTVYAHNNKLLVSEGAKVQQGDLIAYSGSTGNSTGPHLHFEIRKNNNYINPLNYLNR